ncbi:MAG: class II aldolase/adducin family protein, partial [Spirochaetales bacterium]|nr:class II aldolase/adducin family protein [Spirochaetales bacterium]
DCGYYRIRRKVLIQASDMHDTSEGIIKFACHWQQCALYQCECAHAVLDVRNRLWDRGLVGAAADGTGFGNVSSVVSRNEARELAPDLVERVQSRYHAGQRYFLVTGSQTGREAVLDISGLSLVLEWNLAANELACAGPVRASSESLTHAALYEAESRIGGVVHVHAPWYWAHWPENAPRTAADVSYGTPAMGYEIQRIWRETGAAVSGAVCMGGHRDGLLAWGETVEQALETLLTMLAHIEQDSLLH